jgi:hypothetical protein
MPKEIEFESPEGFAAPEDTEQGKSFEVLATLRQKEDGKLCLEAIDGVAVTSAEAKETPEMEEEEDFLGAVEKGMAG